MILAPPMTTLMGEHPATAGHLAQVAADLLAEAAHVVDPISKKAGVR